MKRRRDARHSISGRGVWRTGIAVCFIASILACGHAQAPQSGSPVELDRVVAVVNGRAILASEVNNEIRLSVLEPNNDGEREGETPQEALQRLISRTLIRQQIRKEDERTLVPTAEEVTARVAELRKRLPACVHANCETDAGWETFLDDHSLTQRQVQMYLRNRMEVLRFIEQRFRQGIQISPEEVEAYYRNTLLPQYPPGQAAPPVDQVSSRIEEILLQQHVTDLFSGWLDNLRTQGDIEVLDPTLASAVEAGGPTEARKGNSVQKGPAVR
jgi:peptidyl-prolyl cis-trans isomerase SurA